MDVVGCGARWGWRPIGVGSKGVGGIGSSSCVGASGCKVVVRWSEGLGVGAVVAIGVCVRARCFLGGVGVPLCVSCVCPWGSGLCCPYLCLFIHFSTTPKPGVFFLFQRKNKRNFTVNFYSQLEKTKP